MFYSVTRDPGDSGEDLISFIQKSILVGEVTGIIRGGEQSHIIQKAGTMVPAVQAEGFPLWLL